MSEISVSRNCSEHAQKGKQRIDCAIGSTLGPLPTLGTLLWRNGLRFSHYLYLYRCQVRSRVAEKEIAD